MMPITSLAGWGELYSLCRTTRLPVASTARASLTHVVIFMTSCGLDGLRVASERQIDLPPLVASTAMPWPWTCPSIATTRPGTLTFHDQWVSEKPAGMEYSE